MPSIRDGRSAACLPSTTRSARRHAAGDQRKTGTPGDSAMNDVTVWLLARSGRAMRSHCALDVRICEFSPGAVGRVSPPLREKSCPPCACPPGLEYRGGVHNSKNRWLPPGIVTLLDIWQPHRHIPAGRRVPSRAPPPQVGRAERAGDAVDHSSYSPRKTNIPRLCGVSLCTPLRRHTQHPRSHERRGRLAQARAGG